MAVPVEVRRQQDRERSRRYYVRHRDEVKKRKLRYRRDKAAEHQRLVRQLDALRATVRSLEAAPLAPPAPPAPPAPSPEPARECKEM